MPNCSYKLDLMRYKILKDLCIISINKMALLNYANNKQLFTNEEQMGRILKQREAINNSYKKYKNERCKYQIIYRVKVLGQSVKLNTLLKYDINPLEHGITEDKIRI